MILIEDPPAFARLMSRIRNPWLRRRLALLRDRLAEAGCRIGDLGPIIIVGNGDTLAALEARAGVTIAPAPGWEYCINDHGWCEAVFITGDDGSGTVLFIPDRDGIDRALLAIVQAHAQDISTTSDLASSR